jgi:hypothetical protein
MGDYSGGYRGRKRRDRDDDDDGNLPYTHVTSPTGYSNNTFLYKKEIASGGIEAHPLETIETANGDTTMHRPKWTTLCF